MYKTGDYVIAKVTKKPSNSIIINKKYKIVSYIIGSIFYQIKDEYGHFTHHYITNFYSKQEIRDMKLDNLISSK